MPSATPRATVLLTRPLLDSQRFAAHLPVDLHVVIAPILEIVPLPHNAERLAGAQGLVFTSAHAVGAAGPGRGRIAICVGPRTAALAREAGFEVTEGPGDAQGLLPLIAASPVPLIHPHGRHVAQTLPVEGVEVYDQRPLLLTDQALRLLAGDGPVILPLFSPRSARLLSQAIGTGVAAPLWLVAISESARGAWGGPPAPFRIAERPDAEAMKKAILDLHLPEQ